MASINAKETAKDVLETIGKGEPVNLGKIISKRYAKSTSLTPQLVTETKSYQEVIKPVLEQYQAEEQRILKAMSAKDISAEKYETLVNASDKVRKQVQLLSGGATERQEIKGDVLTDYAGIPGMDEIRKKHLDEIRKAIAKQHGIDL